VHNVFNIAALVYVYSTQDNARGATQRHALRCGVNAANRPRLTGWLDRTRHLQPLSRQIFDCAAAVAYCVQTKKNKRLNRQVPGNVLIELGHTELQRRPQADMLYSICLVPVRLLSVNRYRLPCTACSIVQSNKLSMLLLRTITRDYTEFGVFINSTACNLCAAKRSP